MPIELTMPRLSDTMEKGTIIKWNVSEGEEVSSGQAVADIETDKATMEMQVYDDGVLAKIIVGEGEQVDVGTVIALVAEDDEDPKEVAKNAGSAAKSKKSTEEDDGEDEASSDKSEAKQSESKKSDSKQREKQSASSSSSGGDGKSSGSTATKSAATQPSSNGAEGGADRNGRMRISPVARRMAEDHGVDLNAIEGSGPNGRIIKRDVQNAIDTGATAAPSTAGGAAFEAPSSTKLEAGRVQLSNMRQTIAKRLVESKTTIPHYQVTMSFNLDPLLDLRKTLNEQLEAQGVKLSVNDFLIRACALAIHQHRDFNASWKGDSLEVHGDVNVGVAVALPAERGGGLVVATIRNADRKGLRQISHEAKTLSEKARTKGLTLDEMNGSTFTISNLGMFGVEHFTAIINPPNSAILAVGAGLEKPVVRDGQIVIGHEMQATLSLDHRVIDGATAAQYLQTLKQFIENPATLLV